MAAAEQMSASPPPSAAGEQVGRRTGCAVPLPDAPCRFERACRAFLCSGDGRSELAAP